MGYDVAVEKGSLGARNIVIGDPTTAKYIVTAHYDTPAVLPFPNLLTPCNFFAFLAYQVVITAFILVAVSIPGILIGVLLHDPSLAALISLLLCYLVLGLMLLGPSNKSNANDNTSGVVAVLEIARSLPEALKDRVCFVLFDLEEAGLVGSASYAKAHKKRCREQMIVNLDCVGDGDELMIFPNTKVKRNQSQMQALQEICGNGEGKTLTLREKGFAYFPSDQKHFPYGVGVAAFRRSKLVGLYCDKIHTGKDKILDEGNINFLRDRLTQLFGIAM